MKKYEYGTEENMVFLRTQRDRLFSFGERFPSPGGGAYYLGEDGTPQKDRPRETWISARMAHVYAIGEMLGYPGCGKLADAALGGLKGELRDAKNGGWYAGLCADGTPLPDKQCYAHAFVILAACSLLLAKREGAGELLQEALFIFDRYFWDEKEGLTVDLWDTAFSKQSDYRGLNANMHTVEAFLAVADAAGNEKYRKRAGRIIDHVMGWMTENDFVLPEHFSREWIPDYDYNREKPEDPFKPYGTTPGHSIEWARLILQWALSDPEAGEKRFSAYLQASEALYDQARKNAWSADGAPGFCYTIGWDKKPLIHDRMHWVLAEAINTSAFLYRVTRKQSYADDYREYMEYLDGCVIDPQNGSWYHQLDQNGKVLSTVWPGKPDLYHALQAMLIPYVSTPEVSIAAAVKASE